MRFRVARYRVALGAVWIAASVAAAGAQAGAGDEEADGSLLTLEFSGRLSAESRGFPAAGAFPGQRSLAAGFVVEPTVYVEAVSGASFTLVPFLRYDHSDPGRTHFDLREAYLLLFGDAGDGGWEARVGVGQVFWGATESQRLVDIVNQVDFVEHLNGEAKLGQPMAHLTWFGNWGTLEVLGTSYHRARTFPGRRGRLRLPLLIDHEHVQYESSARQWHLDFASRYSRSFGSLDLGVSVFDGTSREPSLLPGGDAAGAPALLQYYAQIRQFGLDVQWTLGSSLLKAEAIRRTGARNLIGREQDYFAAVLGTEFPFYAVAGSGIDITLLGEWSYDSRGPTATPNRSPNTLENDLFLATRFAFNDVQSSELTTSVVADARRATRALALEFGRRITNEWSLRAEAVALLSVDQSDLHYEMRRDSFIDMSLTYNF